MGHGHSKAAAANPQLPPDVAARGFPRKFVASYTKAWSTKVTVLLSDPDSSDQPAYAVTLDQGWYGAMTLHGGPNKDHEPLANVQPAGRMRQDFSITLPALPPHVDHQRTEILRWSATMKRELFWFAMEIGDGEHRHVEKFEWRRSHGSEVKRIGGKAAWGWKLLRMGNDMGGDDHDHDESGERVDGLSSDNKEIVAVWAESSSFKSMSKIGDFEFKGSGATGELGQLWSIMAAVSCMCIWQKTMQVATANGIAAA